MGTGSGHDSQNIEISGAWPVPVPIFFTNSHRPTAVCRAKNGRTLLKTLAAGWLESIIGSISKRALQS
jgi:hypothetical protein